MRITTARVTVFALIITTFSAISHDMVPGKSPTPPILLKDATLHTATNGTMENHDLLIVDGKIQAIAGEIPVDEQTDVIDLSGMHVYPGLIGMSTTLGLVEIGAVRATRDQAETGRYTPEVEAHVAFNADSEVIPTVRANGITHVEVAPVGVGLTGQASVMHLDGWNWQDSLVKQNSAMHLYWPNTGINKSFWERRTVEEQRKDNAEQLEDLMRTFELIKAYHQRREHSPDSPIDVRWEAMRPVFKGDVPLFVHADDYRQMEQAVTFAAHHEINIVLVGGADVMMAIDLLRSSQTPLVFTAPWGTPQRSDQAYDVAYAIPALLEQNDIPFALAIAGSWNVRDLPFAAGQIVAHGASKAQALRSVTIAPARILGIDDSTGSIEVGKQANLVVSEGDLFDHLTHKVTMMMIDGRRVDLNSRHTQLYEKYKQKTSE
ncbi:MAG: amidohydrolase family protein [Pseudomonadota bacterium]